ncbi:hypothetical protein ACFY05_08820 [Microtetraspora fusca]|uniref:Ribosomal RNA large subunit methyltransferase K/L-like methyltransferase domain-containing protein n=1 Tax=Microtetraspora fusca TaxID=1997 RepID=A0ABW6V3M4_MICFU
MRVRAISFTAPRSGSVTVSSTAPTLVARCVHGLEPTLAAEILQLGAGVITYLGHREIHFRTRRPRTRAVALRTPDDVFLLAARCADIGVAKQGVSTLARLADLADLDSLARGRRRQGGPGTITGIEVSASFLGRRNFNRYDVEDAVGRALARRLGVGYHSRRTGTAPPAGYAGWRVTLDGAHATLMLRIADRPLHRRDYRRRTVPGSLHPPLAAAMVRMADIRPGHTVVDPCCGAGTLLIEAAAQQPQARLYGFDLEVTALRASHDNATLLPVAFPADTERRLTPAGDIDPARYNTADTRWRSMLDSDVGPGLFTWPEVEGLPTPDSGGAPAVFSQADAGSSPTPDSSINRVVFARADAGRLPMPDGSADRILSNPPWGGQVAGSGLLSSSTSLWWAELRRVLAPGATAVVLLPDLDDLPIGVRHQLVPTHLQRVRVSGAESYLVRLVAPRTRRGRKASPRNERTPL